MEDVARRRRAASAIQRVYRAGLGARKLSRMARWRTPKTNMPGGEYRFTRITSSNASGSALVLGTDAGGVQKFYVGGNNADNLQISFSLQQTIIYLGGVAQITSVCPDYAEFTSLFDQWCIDKVEVMLIPTYTNADISSTASRFLPNIVHCTDDDDAASGSRLFLQQYGNAKYTQLLEGMKPLRVFRPKPALAVYQTGATFAYGEVSRGPKWIDVAYPTVPHYSLKMALDNAGTGATSATIAYLDVVVKYHYRFKTVR